MKTKIFSFLVLSIILCVVIFPSLPVHASTTETLRPNGSGDSTQLNPVGDSPNYKCVDDVSSDGDTTYVATTTAKPSGSDLYNIEDTNILAGSTINGVTVYALCRSISTTYKASFWISLKKSGGTPQYGAEHIPSTTYTLYDDDFTGISLSDLNGLQIGISIASGSDAQYYSGRCTQVYVIIYYTPPVTLTITSPTNTTYTNSTITITMSASGGTIYRIWFNIKSGGSWLYSNTTYTAPTTKTLTNGIYTFYGWANNTDGNSDSKTVVFTVNTSGFNLYFQTNGKLAFQHLSVPWETKAATITLTVTSGTLNGIGVTLAMYPTSGTLTFTALENGAITLTSTSNTTTFHVNGEVATSASLVNGQSYTIEWSFLEPEFLLPIMFILGMFGLGSMFGGPIYGIYKVKHGEYYEGFKTGLILTVLGVALTIAWLWGA